LGTKNWIFSNCHPRLAKAHVLKLDVSFGPHGPSCGVESEQWLFLGQWLFLDVDRGCLGCTLGLGATSFIERGLHGIISMEEGLVHMPSGWMKA
jgi:hypothetical protein